jgi:hypothetical protein
VLINNGFSDADGVELHASKTPATALTAPGDGRLDWSRQMDCNHGGEHAA